MIINYIKKIKWYCITWLEIWFKRGLPKGSTTGLNHLDGLESKWYYIILFDLVFIWYIVAWYNISLDCVSWLFERWSMILITQILALLQSSILTWPMIKSIFLHPATLFLYLSICLYIFPSFFLYLFLSLSLSHSLFFNSIPFYLSIYLSPFLSLTLYSSTTWLRRCRQFPLTSNILKMKNKRKRVSQRKRDRDRKGDRYIER